LSIEQCKSVLQSQREQKNDAEVIPPALLLNDNNCEWDSALEDDTKSQIDERDISFFRRDFQEKYDNVVDAVDRNLCR